MTGLLLSRLLCLAPAAVFAACGLFLLHPASPRAVRALPRARALGMLLSAGCWAWVAAELWFHPIDFLAFLSPGMVLTLGALCIPLSWVLLENLLCARAVGGLLMLWPMPVILAVRDQVTAWRLVPVALGYASLTFGMFVVFYPWLLRAVCDALAERPGPRRAAGVALTLAGALCAAAALALGKAVGE